MIDEIYACYNVGDYNYQCKNFKDFIDLNEFYKNTNKSLIIIPTKHKINYDRDDLLKDEITKNITGYENRFTWSSRLTRAVLNIKLD